MMASRSSCGSRGTSSSWSSAGQRVDLRGQPGEVGPRQRGELGIRLVGELPSLLQFVSAAGRAGRRAERWARAGCAPGRATGAARDPGRLPGRRGARLDLLRPASAWRSRASMAYALGAAAAGSRLVLPAEPVDPAGGVHQALLAGEIRVALGAHFHVDRRGGRAGLERFPQAHDGRELACSSGADRPSLVAPRLMLSGKHSGAGG